MACLMCIYKCVQVALRRCWERLVRRSRVADAPCGGPRTPRALIYEYNLSLEYNLHAYASLPRPGLSCQGASPMRRPRPEQLVLGRWVLGLPAHARCLPAAWFNEPVAFAALCKSEGCRVSTSCLGWATPLHTPPAKDCGLLTTCARNWTPRPG